MPMIVQNAASLAYQKAIAKTRESLAEDSEQPVWLTHFANKLTEDDSEAAPSSVLRESGSHRKERKFAKSDTLYFRLAWLVHSHITSKTAFEVFILLNIILVGVITGLDLENDGRDQWTVDFSNAIGSITLVVFTLECALKIIAEGDEPWMYFLDRVDGSYNCFDFFVVVLSYLFIETAGTTISGLRMLRLVRLMTFVKDVPKLRIIFAGLLDGMRSVVYIVMLLCLVVYIFAILGCILFGENDPAHFGSVSIAMVSLFQVSTLASWTSIAYVSWFGCEHYLGSPYDDSNPSMIHTTAGDFQGFKCTSNIASPVTTGLFFAFYILLTAWVIMSLFIGVITIGMFEAYLALKEERSATAYIKQLTLNSRSEADCEADGDVTLKELIDIALGDDLSANKDDLYHRFVESCYTAKESKWFTNLITATIVLVGVVIGLDTDFGMYCDRLDNRMSDRDDDERSLHDCRHPPVFFQVVTILAQIIFTFEAAVKISAEGRHPLRYFTDAENGGWNCLDFFIVVAGFIELTPAKFVFESFPIVLLRLLRLLRVFRLAKAFPRLRSIVEALISGFSSVGWICLLIFVFNYICACMCMIFFKENDPFHFGGLAQSMFTVLRIETLDSWDQILYIAMFGCASYPGGYEFLEGNPNSTCSNSKGFGGFAVLMLLVVTIIGAYILPTVLIGIVSIKFDDSSKEYHLKKEEKNALSKHLDRAKEYVPGVFTHDRVDAIVKVFRTLNSGGQHTLDMTEISPFFHYAIDLLFQVELDPSQCQSLFYLLDSSKSTEIGLGEFVTFISILMHMKQESKSNPKFALEFFGSDAHFSVRDKNKSIWDSAMQRVHKETYENTWSSVLRSINGVPGNTTKDKVLLLFSHFDSDGTGAIDAEELGLGLESCGVLLNDSQLAFFFNAIDEEKDGEISIEDFVKKIEAVKEERIKKNEEEAVKELGFLQRKHYMKQKKLVFDKRNVDNPSINATSSLRTTPVMANYEEIEGGVRYHSKQTSCSSSETSSESLVSSSNQSSLEFMKLEKENQEMKKAMKDLEASFELMKQQKETSEMKYKLLLQATSATKNRPIITNKNAEVPSLSTLNYSRDRQQTRQRHVNRASNGRADTSDRVVGMSLDRPVDNRVQPPPFPTATAGWKSGRQPLGSVI